MHHLSLYFALVILCSAALPAAATITVVKDKPAVEFVTKILREQIEESILEQAARDKKRGKVYDQERIDFEIAERLSHFQILAETDDAEFFKTLPASMAILEKLDRLDPNPNDVTFVAFVEEMQENASMLEIENGKKLILINKGFYFSTANDHQFAFVASHEMEHPHAQLEKNAQELFGEKKAKFFKRTEESEIDLRAVYHRLIKAGFNPYAAEDWFQAMIDKHGDSLTSSHTSTASRRDGVSGLIASLRRHRGQDISRPEKFEDTAVTPVKTYLSSPQHRARQARLLQNYVNGFNSHPEKIYDALAQGEEIPDHHRPQEAIERAKHTLLRLGSNLFNALELDKYLAQIHFRMDQQYEAAHQKFLESNPKARGHHWVQQYRSLQFRRFSSMMPELENVLSSIEKNRKDIEELEGKLRAASSSDEREKLESQLIQERAKTVTLEADQKLALQAYEIIPAHTMAHLKEAVQGDAAAQYTFVDQYLRPLRKHGLGALFTNRLQALATISDDHRKALVEELARDTSVGSDDYLNDIWRLDPALKREIQIEALQNYVRFIPRVGAQYAQAGRFKEVEAHFLRFNELRVPHHALKVAFAHDAEATQKMWTEFVSSLLALEFSSEAKKDILESTVFSSRLEGLIPAAELAQLRERFLPEKQRLIFAAFLKETEKEKPEEIARQLLRFLQREKFSVVPATLLQPCLDAFEKGLRKEGVLIHNYDLQFILLTPAVWEKMDPATRPSLGTLWDFFIKLPTQRMSGKEGKYYRIEFDNIYDLFSQHTSEWALFTQLIEHRHRLNFDNSVTDVQARNREKFFEFAQRHRPADAEFFARISRPHHRERAPLKAAREKTLSEFMRKAFAEHRHEPVRERTFLVGREVIRQFEDEWGKQELGTLVNDLQASWLPTDRAQRLEMVLVVLGLNGTFGEYRGEGRLSTQNIFKTDESFEGIPLELLFEYWSQVAFPDWPAPENDRIFNYIWRNISKAPALTEKFTFPELVPKLNYDDEKEKLAEWQIRWFLSQAHPKVEKNGIRPIVLKVAGFIETQFKTASFLRNRMLSLAEEILITNAAETEHLKGLRQSADSPKASGSMLIVDSVHQLARAARSNFEKLEMIEYLAGKDRPRPSFISEDSGKALKRVFLNAGEQARTFAFQAALDEKTGVLSEVAVKDRLFRFMLGENASHKVVRAIFERYLDVVEPSERVILIAHALASMSGRGGERISVRTMLELMGPLGIKAGQFLKTTGLVNAEIRKELDDFLDRALAPIRHDIFSRLKEIFGDDLTDIELVEELIGSGSINYVVKGKMRGRTIAFRLLREEAEGQVALEDQNWQKVIASMIASDDLDVQRQGRILEEARAHSMQTLGRGGDEFNLELERQNYDKANRVYSAPADPQTGFRIEAMKPDFELQQLVPAQFAKSITIMEFVNATSLKKMDAKLRQQLTAQIVTAELHAIFEKGIFDADGHPGNWLADVGGHRLVRIDYAQMHEITSTTRALIREILKLMVQPNFSAQDIERLAQLLPQAFAVNGAATSNWALALREILKSSEFPSHQHPHERLLHLREALERQLGRGVTVRFNKDLRTVMSALGRINGFRDFMASPAEFNRLLLHALGTSRTDLTLTTIRNGWKNLCENLLKSRNQRSFE